MDKDAHSLFFGWWNRNVDAINAIEDDEDVETRVMNYIKELMKSGLITKAKKGFYEKVKFETGQATET